MLKKLFLLSKLKTLFLLLHTLAYQQGHCSPNRCPKQNCIVVPLCQILSKEKKHIGTRDQNRTLIMKLLFAYYICSSRQIPHTTATIYICLVDFIVSSIQKSRKRKLDSFTTIKPWLIFIRVVMSTCFCWRNYRGCVIYLKTAAKNVRLSGYLN